MNYVKQLFGGNLRQLGMIGALAVIILFFQIRTDGLTLSPDNMISVVSQYSYILILAIGMVMVIIAGHIDLSVGSVAAFVGIVVAKLMDNGNGMSWPLAVIVGLLLGAVVGAIHGYFVAYVGVPAFIVTLAGMLVWRGMNQVVGNSTSTPVPDGFQKIGAGYPPEFGGGNYHNFTLILGGLAMAYVIWHEFRDRSIRRAMGAPNAPMPVSVARIALVVAVLAAATLIFASGRPGTGFPYSGLILVGLVILYSFITNNTVIGRHIYAVGGNSRAAALSGVKAQRINFLVMMNMSILTALAGMIFVARSTASGPADGNGWELDAIASVFIGGAAVSGGVGTVIGSIVGGLVMAFLNNGLALLGTDQSKVQIIKGAVLLIAVSVDVLNKRHALQSLMARFRGNKVAVDVAPAVTTSAPADLTDGEEVTVSSKASS